MKIYLLFILLFAGSYSFAQDSHFGKSWKLKALHCPFSCSSSLEKQFAKAKATEIAFSTEKADLPEAIAACVQPAKPNWSTLQTIKLKDYLNKWSQNEEAMKKPKIQKNISKHLGFKNNPEVKAGVVSCSDGTAFNLLVVGDKKAFLIFEENSYFELAR